MYGASQVSESSGERALPVKRGTDSWTALKSWMREFF
jgi:hypothetical protein